MRLGHITGIIMYKDTELCWFDVNDTIVKYEPIGVSEEYTPWEFINGYTANSVLNWLHARLPEDNRQFLAERCKEYNISMTGEDILKISHGREVNDSCWIKFHNGPQSSAEVLI